MRLNHIRFSSGCNTKYTDDLKILFVFLMSSAIWLFIIILPLFTIYTAWLNKKCRFVFAPRRKREAGFWRTCLFRRGQPNHKSWHLARSQEDIRIVLWLSFSFSGIWWCFIWHELNPTVHHWKLHEGFDTNHHEVNNFLWGNLWGKWTSL